MTYSELMICCGIAYGIILIVIVISTIAYMIISKKQRGKAMSTVFHIGRPVTQFIVIFMVVTLVVMTSKYFKVKSFEQVATCQETGTIYGIRITHDKEQIKVIKDQAKIHKIITTLEESTYVPSFFETTKFATDRKGREIQVEFLGMEKTDSVTINNCGIIYNNCSGQAYQYMNDQLFIIVESMMLNKNL